jgi:hypothetical protein
MSNLSLNNIVPITIALSASAQAARDFSVGMVVTHAAGLPAGGRVQTFTSAADVLAAFAADTVLNQFADIYFGQDDFTPTSLKVGVRDTTAGTGDASMTAALAACQDADPTFYGVACVSDTSAADQILAEAWCQANKCRFFFCTQEADVLSPTDPPTNMLYLAKVAAYSRTAGLFTTAAADEHVNAHAAHMAFWMTTNYDQPNSIKTALQANFTGIGSSSITQSDFLRICGNPNGSAPGWNGNVYATFGNSPMLMRGQAADGRFIDEGMALDWLSANIQVDIVNEMRKQRIPLTDKGSQYLCDAARNTLLKAVRNGLAAPGIWNFPGFGDLKKGDTIPEGFYIYAQPVSTLTDADRTARKAPAITIALVGAGAIQYCAPTIIFQR